MVKVGVRAVMQKEDQLTAQTTTQLHREIYFYTSLLCNFSLVILNAHSLLAPKIQKIAWQWWRSRRRES